MGKLVDRALDYVQAVESGDRPAGPLEIAAVARFRAMLEVGRYRFNRDLAEWSCGFFSYCCHSKGELRGQPIDLEPWQAFLFANLWGWQKEDGTRLFRQGYVQVGKKNGKSTLAAGFGLYHLDYDGEPGSEVYSCATKMDQARIVHRSGEEMCEQSPELASKIELYRHRLSVVDTGSFWIPIASDAAGTEGVNPQAFVADEVHAWPKRDLWDVLISAMVARRQPQALAITTAGYDRETICGELRNHSQAILENVFEDPEFFCMVFEPDEKDDFWDPATWPKGNPNLGVSVKLDFLKAEAKRAQETSGKANAFLRYHLDRWTAQETRWFNMADWRACPMTLPEPTGPCCAGIDVSTNTDLTSIAYAWLLEDGEAVAIRWRFFIPKQNAIERAQKDRVPYLEWERRGLVELTPGNTVDQNRIRDQFLEDAKRWDVREVGVDPWNSGKLSQEIVAAGHTVVTMRQGFQTMNEPAQALEGMLRSRRVYHGDHPIARWNFSNAQKLERDGYIRPVKDNKSSTKRIDGVIAAILALGRALFQDTGGAGTSDAVLIL